MFGNNALKCSIYAAAYLGYINVHNYKHLDNQSWALFYAFLHDLSHVYNREVIQSHRGLLKHQNLHLTACERKLLSFFDPKTLSKTKLKIITCSVDLLA